MFIYTYVHMYIYVYIYICTYVYICLYTCNRSIACWINTCRCTGVYAYTYIYMFTCVYMYGYTYIHMYVYVNIPATAPSRVGEWKWSPPRRLAQRKFLKSQIHSHFVYTKLSSELAFENFYGERRWSPPHRLAQRTFRKSQIHRHFIYYIEQRAREVGGWGRVPFSTNFMKPTPHRKWYLTTGRRSH